MDVYVLQHVHTVDDEEDVKMIGVYSSYEQAMVAIECLRFKPGFAEAQDKFSIDQYTLDADHWTEGYVRVHPKSE